MWVYSKPTIPLLLIELQAGKNSKSRHNNDPYNATRLRPEPDILIAIDNGSPPGIEAKQVILNLLVGVAHDGNATIFGGS